MAFLKVVYWATVIIYVASLTVLTFATIIGARIGSKSLYVMVGIVAGFFVLLLVSSLFLFLRSESIARRSAALVIIALPLVLGASFAGASKVQRLLNTDKAGNEAYFPAGPLRDIGAAISLNDAATVASLAPKVDLNTQGTNGQTLLVSAVNQLEKTPDRLDVMRILLKDGADPNLGPQEQPLRIAIRLSGRTGPEPVRMLLAAGANPNARDSFGAPTYFLAANLGTPELFQLLLDHGADINAKGYLGQPVIFAAASQRNWSVVLFLLKRGVDWKHEAADDGMSFRKYVEREGAGSSENEQRLYAEVLEYLGSH